MSGFRLVVGFSSHFLVLHVALLETDGMSKEMQLLFAFRDRYRYAVHDSALHPSILLFADLNPIWHAYQVDIS